MQDSWSLEPEQLQHLLGMLFLRQAAGDSSPLTGSYSSSWQRRPSCFRVQVICIGVSVCKHMTVSCHVVCSTWKIDTFGHQLLQQKLYGRALLSTHGHHPNLYTMGPRAQHWKSRRECLLLPARPSTTDEAAAQGMNRELYALLWTIVMISNLRSGGTQCTEILGG